jgi:hypothetical protein
MNNPLAGYCKKIILLLFPLTLLEFIFFPSTNNIYGICTFGLAWFVSTKIVFEQIDIRDHFIPQIILFIFLCSFFLLPLIITLTEFKPLTFNMFVPWDVFTHQLLLVITICIALRASANLNMSKALSSFLQKKTHFFTPPTEKQVWLIGIISFVLWYIAYTSDLGWITKLLEGFKVFTLTPYILIAPQLYNGTKPKNLVLKLTFWTVAIAIMGIAVNSRGLMLMGVISIFTITFMDTTFRKAQNLQRKFILAIILTLLFSGIVTRFTISMLAVRSIRTDISPVELVKQTIAIYNDDARYEKIKQLAIRPEQVSYSQWNETYSNNIILERIGNLKVCDNTIFYSQQIGYKNPSVKTTMLNKILASLPQPILDLLNININKQDLEFSMGDKIYATYTQNNDYLGSFVVSSFHSALAAFGYLMYPITLVAFFMLCSLLNSLSQPNKTKRLSPLAILLAYEWLNILNNSGGLLNITSYITRTFWQDIILYLLLFSLTLPFAGSRNITNNVR